MDETPSKYIQDPSIESTAQDSSSKGSAPRETRLIKIPFFTNMINTFFKHFLKGILKTINTILLKEALDSLSVPAYNSRTNVFPCFHSLH